MQTELLIDQLIVYAVGAPSFDYLKHIHLSYIFQGNVTVTSVALSIIAKEFSRSFFLLFFFQLLKKINNKLFQLFQ